MLSSSSIRRTFAIVGVGSLAAPSSSASPRFSSTRLHDLIVAANQYVDEWVKRHPDKPGVGGDPPVINKPPFAGGDFFTGNVEGARSFKVSRTVRGSNRTWIVYVRFWYESGLEGWEDAVVVIADRGSYRIDDVVFSGDPPAHPPGRLSAILRQRGPD